LRSPLVLNDQKGDVLAAIVQNGRTDRGMPKFDMSGERVADIAAFLHSIDAGSGESAFKEESILVGNARSGEAYFNGKGGCTSCHSVTGDLAGIGARLSPKSLQDAIANGGGSGVLGTRVPSARPRSVRVTLSSGSVIEGQLEGIDDFAVTVSDSTGSRRTFRREGDVPKVEVHDPYAAHIELLKTGRDADIHDLTAYLAGLK
jgi:mono/diheme cytochrome c family protein